MTLTGIRAALESLGTRARQSLGQNFLHDQNVARALVEQIDGYHDGTLLEIGPGLGALTQHLRQRARRLILLEKDSRMVRWLEEHCAGPGVELRHSDALDFDLRELCGEGRVAVIGNLPYYVSTPLIAKFTASLSPASILALTLQKEVAERLCASPGSRAFGAMSVCVQRRWEARLTRKLPPTVFYPAPKVASAAVVLTPRPPETLRALDEAAFEALVRRGFSERRKQLRALLPEWRASWDALCERVGIAPAARAETLRLDQWEELTLATSPAAAQRLSEDLDVVDERDRVLEVRPREFVHVNNLRHRAVHILIFNARGEVFLQKRSPWKDRNPLLWDSSAAGHVDAGETYPGAARRETLEELGVELSLERIARLESSAATGWEFVEVFRGRHEGPFQLARMEIEAGAFFAPARIASWLERRPGDFTPLFRGIFEREFADRK